MIACIESTPQERGQRIKGVRILFGELRCCYSVNIFKATVCEDRSLFYLKTIKTLYNMNDIQEFMDTILGSPNKTVLKVPTFSVKTIEREVARIDYWEYEGVKWQTFDDIINIVKKSVNLPAYNKLVGDASKRTIILYRKETVVTLNN
jgi:hypothetical protein